MLIKRRTPLKRGKRANPELTREEKLVLYMQPHQSLASIARAWGKSRQRIHAIYCKAKKKLEAQKDMRRHQVHLPDKDLAYFSEGSELFDEYVEAVEWAQDYAMLNRQRLLAAVVEVLKCQLPSFRLEAEAINCHHNYVAREQHFGENLFITRKGAISARAGELGIIPGSMGAKSYIVRGLGNAQSFCSCSHGAGRRMSRSAAKRSFSRFDLEAQTSGVECRKDGGVIDEIPGAYKDIDQVMDDQRDLVEVVHTLKQVLCVKG